MPPSDVTVAVIDATGAILSNLGRAARSLPPELGVRVMARSREDLSGPRPIAACAEEIAKADMLILIPHGGAESIPGFDQLAEAGKDIPIHVQVSAGSPESLELARRFSADFGTPAFARRQAYLAKGGPDNLRHLLRFLAGGEDVPPAADVPIQGIYHPDYAGPSDPDAYLAWARTRLSRDESAPVVGLWFYRTYWLGGDLDAYDALIEEIEAQGGVPLALFHIRAGDSDLGGMPVPDLARIFFQGRIDVLLSPMSFSLARMGGGMEAVLPDLDVPVLQLIVTGNSRALWEESEQAVTPVDVSTNAAQPEFDGVLIGTVIATREAGAEDLATGARLVRRLRIEDRCRQTVAWAMNWARLRRTPPAERRIAILFHHYPPKNDRLGSAVGLDSFASVKSILDRLTAEGYRVERDYADGEALAFELLDRLTNDRRYLPPEAMATRAVASVDTPTANRWHGERAEKLRREMEEKWGPPPGITFAHDGNLLIGGVVNGNVFIGMQPPRGRMEEGDEPTVQQDGKAIHDPYLPATHHYLAYYRWLREEFGAQVVYHIGTHGTLEWMPGKSLGLSRACYPDAAIADLPNLYPYNISIPGEGTQAKRRSYACILDHMIPAQTHAGKSDPLAAVEEELEKAYFLKLEDPAKLPLVLERLWEKVEAAHLDRDTGLSRADFDTDPDDAMRRLHGYLNEVEVTSINDGLHVFGRPPEGNRLSQTLVHLTRLPNGPHGSLWDAAAAARGLNGEDLRDDPGGLLPHLGKTKGQVLGEIVEDSAAALDELAAAGWDDMAMEDVCAARFGGSPRVGSVLRFVRDEVRPKVLGVADELEFAARGTAGRFVPPGGSGAPTRGSVDILPTGRNFFSIDPLKIPSPEAWEAGCRMGDALVERFRADEGRWPEQLGMVLWSSPTMRTRGDDVAQILYLMGTRPVWEPGSGRVRGAEPIPLAERTFPRLDVTVRASGLFRDTFPNVMELIDEATRLVAGLAEPAELNLLARNVAVDAETLLKAGLSPEEAARRAAFRVFSDRPGTYGAGVNALLGDGRWKEVAELGDIYIHWGGYAYGAGTYGEDRRDDFRTRMGRLDLTVKNSDTREHDIFASDDFNAYHGGMNAAVRSASGRQVRSYTGDANDPRRARVRSTAEEGRFIFRTRVLNPKWIEGMKRHGYKGAGDLSRLVEYCFQWDATSKILEDWQYAELARTYAFDPAMREFFRHHNPHALHNIAERLLEAIGRGLWQDPGEDEERLRALFLDAEGDVEDTLSPAARTA
jgi:cobaltochelatase CobN